jgi:hypothetical protein
LANAFVERACFDCGYAAGDVARKGNQMKMTFAVLALCAFAQGALAAGPDCRAIESTSGRLACYDAAHPPKMEKPTVVENDAARTAYKDPFIVEDARTAAKLKTICRGCWNERITRYLPLRADSVEKGTAMAKASDYNIVTFSAETRTLARQCDAGCSDSHKKAGFDDPGICHDRRQQLRRTCGHRGR